MDQTELMFRTPTDRSTAIIKSPKTPLKLFKVSDHLWIAGSPLQDTTEGVPSWSRTIQFLRASLCEEAARQLIALLLRGMDQKEAKPI